MGFDLTNDTGARLRFSPSGWALALTLGERYGWQPAGTTLPESAEQSEPAVWSGEYATNDRQRVSASDAKALADACERALADPGFTEITLDTMNALLEYTAAQVRGPKPERMIDLDVAQKFRGRLEELITFCRGGSFIIE